MAPFQAGKRRPHTPSPLRHGGGGDGGRVVAWWSREEWQAVSAAVRSRQAQREEFAIGRLEAWGSRYGSAVPVAVETTLELLVARQHDHMGTGDMGKRLRHGAAIVRFVNLMAERGQAHLAVPLTQLARQLAIPEWAVFLRHDFTHRSLPSLTLCRRGTDFALDWLCREFWSHQLEGDAPPWSRDHRGEWSRDHRGLEGSRGVKRGRASRDLRQGRGERGEAWPRGGAVSFDLSCERSRGGGQPHGGGGGGVDDYVRQLLIGYQQLQFQLLTAGGGRALRRSINEILANIDSLDDTGRESLIQQLIEPGFLFLTEEQLKALQDVQTAPPPCPHPSPPALCAQLLLWSPLLRRLHRQHLLGVLLHALLSLLPPTLSRWGGGGGSGGGGGGGEPEPGDVARWALCIIAANGHPVTRQNLGAEPPGLQFPFTQDLEWNRLVQACVARPSPITRVLLSAIFSSMPLPPPPSLQGRLLTLISLYGGQGSEVAASLEAEWAALSGGAVHCGGTEEGAAALSGGAVHCGGTEEGGVAVAEAVHRGGILTVGDLPAPLHAGSVGATRLGDEGGLVWEAAMTGYIQRQLQGSSWKLCSEFLAWPQCPLGSVPGQSRDPEAMVLTEFTLLEMADGDTGETRGESPSGWPCGGLSPCAPPPGPLWGVEELTLLKGSLQ